MVLSREEVHRLLYRTRNLKHRALFMVIYSGGLRTSEATTLKPSDIDSDRMLIRIRGKGEKERHTLLAEEALQTLRDYYRTYGHSAWLFPGQLPTAPIKGRTVQKLFEQARLRADIQKPATVHTLRHSFATHLLDSGVDITHIQRLLGHKNLETTTIYLHVTTRELARIRSPLDLMEGEPTPTA